MFLFFVIFILSRCNGNRSQCLACQLQSPSRSSLLSNPAPSPTAIPPRDNIICPDYSEFSYYRLCYLYPSSSICAWFISSAPSQDTTAERKEGRKETCPDSKRPNRIPPLLDNKLPPIDRLLSFLQALVWRPGSREESEVRRTN